MMNGLRWGGLCLLALSISACDDGDGRPVAQPRPVRVEEVKLQEYAPVVSLTGEIRARIQTDLAFRISGRVSERLVDVGDHVTADQVLAKLEPREQEADLEAANAAVTAAEAQLAQAKAAFERQQGLIQRGYTTRPTYDQAEAALRTAEGTLASAKAQAETAKELLSYTVLRAGAPGIITARNIEVGQVAQAAQPAFTLAEDGPRDAVFAVHESIFSRQPSSGGIELSLVGDPAVKTIGQVREIAPTVDTKTGTVRVKIGLDSPPPAMTLGSAVTGVGRSKPQPSFIVPWSALTADAGRPAVWLVDPATKTVSLQTVEIEAYQSNAFVVRSGLKTGDLVVVDGGKLLRPGQTVAIVSEARQ
ncbi:MULTISPECIES: efflux RND transporter periplasmic adaptor subunit [Rhodomicrobium]|uniref:efflux RND transporter periplasmic adaptor subunit n=1 Tax=Rhodomicrobium TaxID=1068 RepID=UPI000B4AD7BA|nr:MULTISPECIES: efflux RND transporter periplasmic adaptor subunit [Rhodomicrobium]